MSYSITVKNSQGETIYSSFANNWVLAEQEVNDVLQTINAIGFAPNNTMGASMIITVKEGEKIIMDIIYVMSIFN